MKVSVEGNNLIIRQLLPVSITGDNVKEFYRKEGEARFREKLQDVKLVFS